MSELLIAGGVMLALGLVLGIILAVANKKLFVYEDPRIDAVEGMLPGVNCGACGQAGCRAFAEAVVNGAVVPGKCSVSSAESVLAIAEYLGVEAGSGERQVARIACAGGTHVARRTAFYEGLATCRAAALASGGGKHCSWGCLGYGDCMQACPFDAIVMNQHGMPVVNEEKCTACGNCVTACPKNLISIHPLSHQLWVACRNRLRTKEARELCAVACIGCGLCAKDAPGAITLQDNLPVIDYARNDLAVKEAIQRCPTGAIVWLLPGGEILRGEKAVIPENKTPLPLG